jgi:lysophospholipase L1-like esterase
VRTVLLGDSHLARVRRDLHKIAPGEILNAAVGGATSRDLEAQAHEAEIRPSDDVVVSIGTNDAAPWKQVPLAEYEQRLRELLDNLWPDRTVLVTTPGVDESRLGGAGDRTNRVLATYAATAATVFSEAGATVLDAAKVISPLETAAFAEDGVHLSGEGYRRLLPAIRWACESPSWFDDPLVTERHREFARELREHIATWSADPADMEIHPPECGFPLIAWLDVRKDNVATATLGAHFTGDQVICDHVHNQLFTLPETPIDLMSETTGNTAELAKRTSDWFRIATERHLDRVAKTQA